MSTARRIGLVFGVLAILVPVAAYGRVPTSAAKAYRYRHQQQNAASVATWRPQVLYRSFSYRPSAANTGSVASSSYRSFSYAPAVTQPSDEAGSTDIAVGPSQVLASPRFQARRARVSPQHARLHPGSRRY